MKRSIFCATPPTVRMDTTTLLWTILLPLLTVSAVQLMKLIIRRIRFVRLIDAIPGPLAVPVLGTAIHLLIVPHREIFKRIEHFTKLYSPIFRSWAGMKAEVNLTKPEHFEIIMGNSTHIDKSDFYSFLHPWLGSGLLTSTGSKWHTHRKLITPTFHFSILETFQDVFVEKSQILVEKLHKEANGKGFNIFPYITHCALDVICETAMGTRINAQEDSGSEYVSAIYEMSEISLLRAFRPWLYPDFLFYLSPLGRKSKADLKILHGFTNKVIQERKALLVNAPSKNEDQSNDDLGIKKRKAFLDLLLEVSDNGKTLTDEEIREEVDTFMFEGHDTTSASICWTTFLLGSHPTVQEKVFEELQEIFQGSDRPATTRDLQDMKYLERVLKESLRLYPSVPFIGRRLNEDVQIDEYTIPANSTIWLHIYQMHRNEKLFPNPNKFDPDNFLPENVQGRHPYAYVPFSGGPRNCIGQKFALAEEKTIISSVIRKYKIQSLDREEDIVKMGDLILRPADGINVTLQVRE